MVPSPLINIGWGVERASFYREAPSYGGGSHNYGFPWGTPVPISCPVGKCRTQVSRSELNKLSQRSL